jgi:hypothetical protein
MNMTDGDIFSTGITFLLSKTARMILQMAAEKDVTNQ